MRVFNFSPGPAAIPTAVLERVQQEMLDWNHMGMSAIEISHRGRHYLENIFEPAKANLKKLLNIPENYRIFFITGGAQHQFAMIPINFLGVNKSADYLLTGIWSQKAYQEAQRYGDVRIAADNSANKCTTIPEPSTWILNPRAQYLHYVDNETVNGLEFSYIPEAGEVPLAVDMSSNILSRSIDVSRYGLIYAGAQKNIGPAGLTIVIMREDLIKPAELLTPFLYQYKTYADHDSLYNTPNTFAIYLSGLVFEWILAQGGLEKMAELNKRKAKKLYDYIDQADFYTNHVNPRYRSIMNIVFYCPTPELDQLFVEESAKAGLAYLKGHRLVGGLRASIYNAMPEEGVDALLNFMQDFQRKYA